MRAEGKLIDIDEPRGVINPAHQFIDGLYGACLGGDQAEHNDNTGTDITKRLEAAGPLGIIFKQQTVEIETREQHLGDAVIGSARAASA